MRLKDLFSSSAWPVFQPTLNPKIWKYDVLDQEVREKLLDVAHAFEEYLGVDVEVVDIVLTGSNANYNWTKHSDLDLHLIVPGPVNERDRELYSAKKSLWSESHDIKIKDLPVELYVQDQEEPHYSTGIYSLVHNTWLVKPRRKEPKINDAAVMSKYRDLVFDIKRVLSKDDLAAVDKIKKKIKAMRQAGLESQGEFSVENLVFKLLRNQGYISKIMDRARELEDAQLSLEQVDSSQIFK